MIYAVVLPYAIDGIYQKSRRTMALDNVLAVDNTPGGPYGRNLGIMRSNNLGIDHMRDHDADWLIIQSAAVRYGESGGLDFVAALEANPQAVSVCAVGLYGWHLIAFSRAAVEAAGRFDECLTPYGFDDNDWSIRVHKAIPDGEWVKVPVDASDKVVGMGHSVKLAGVLAPYAVNAEAQLRYFEGKWGARPGVWFDDYYDLPWQGVYSDHVGFWPSSPLTWGAAWNDERCPVEP